MQDLSAEVQAKKVTGRDTIFNRVFYWVGGHAVAQLVEALRYKAEGRGFDSRWCSWDFSFR
jgi:hypothetical protein